MRSRYVHVGADRVCLVLTPAEWAAVLTVVDSAETPDWTPSMKAALWRAGQHLEQAREQLVGVENFT